MTYDRWKHGEFCWYELATSDPAAAKTFYGRLFGWRERDLPAGATSAFALLRFRGADLAAMYARTGPLEGIDPGWIAYVAVSDVDAAAARAEERGAGMLRAPTDVPNVGRMTLFRDPQGALVALLRLTGHPGTGRFDSAPGTFCWSELATGDTESARAFYSAVIGWDTKTEDMGQTKYTEWLVDGRSVGGMMPILPEWGEIPSHWLHYISVEDCDAAVEKAGSLGGALVSPAMDIPNVGRMAVLEDPQGATFAVIRMG